MKFDKMLRAMLLMLTIAALSVVTFSCNDDDDDNNNKRSYTISGDASGDQMVPGVVTTANGTITGSYNPNTKMLSYTTNWTDLSAAPTSGGFYSGASGVNGSIIGMPWTFDETAGATGTRTGTMKLTEVQEEQLLNGDWYYLLNTAQNAAGEIRGQITATKIGSND
jgi:hypothetical protein